MQRTISLFAFLALAAFNNTTRAQDVKPFAEGTVFELTMVHTEANSQEEYLKRLTSFYIPVLRKSQEQGLIKSFRLLAGSAANEEDFDVMLMVEYANMGMMDPDPAREAKWDAIEKEVTATLGGEEKRKALSAGMDEIRHYKGNKMMREMLPK